MRRYFVYIDSDRASARYEFKANTKGEAEAFAQTVIAEVGKMIPVHKNITSKIRKAPKS